MREAFFVGFLARLLVKRRVEMIKYMYSLQEAISMPLLDTSQQIGLPMLGESNQGRSVRNFIQKSVDII